MSQTNNEFDSKEDFEEERRRWEGIHNDEAAQYHLPYTNKRKQDDATSCYWPALVILVLLCVLVFGLYKLF